MSKSPYPEAVKVMEEAISIVTTDRREEYGDWRDNSRDIANIWNAYLGVDVVEPHDVGPMMSLLKMIRHRQNPKHIDNIRDVVGYMGLTAENVENQ